MLPVNFTLSDNAKAEMQEIRRQFDAQAPSPAKVAMVGWAHFRPVGGEPFEQVMIGYYSQREFPEVAEFVQQASGVPLVFFITEADHGRFSGKEIDFDEESGFFLR